MPSLAQQYEACHTCGIVFNKSDHQPSYIDSLTMRLFLCIVPVVTIVLAAIPRPAERSGAPGPMKKHLVFKDTDILDPLERLDEEEFEIEFGLEPITDPAEKQRREDTLKEVEKQGREQNEKFLNGESDFFSRINEFSNLPMEEFKREKTGALIDHGRGLLVPEVKPVHEASERYLDVVRKDNRQVPDHYNAVELGYVSEVKNQLSCGSCVAFASIAAIETCFKMKTGIFGDFSEQQLIDCGYGMYGASACDGAHTSSYLQYVAESGLDLTHEDTYPYLNQEPALTCPLTEPYNIGAEVTDYISTYSGDEATMKKLVAEHGAVVTAVASGDNAFRFYGGGVFSNNDNDRLDHVVTVVGYGTTEDGEDYWLAKNSWGKGWGEGGFMRLKRGVGLRGIGRILAVAICDTVDGPTSPPVTPSPEPCVDLYHDCPELAETNCHHYGEFCRKSCGLCDCLTPHPSNTCWDEFLSCPMIAEMDYCYWFQEECCISCGLGK